MWLAALISFLCYCTVTVLFYILLPSPIPKERDPKQYHGYYTTHVSLVHCIVSLILSIYHVMLFLLVAIKQYVYGWDFCGPNNDFYCLMAIVYVLLYTNRIPWDTICLTCSMGKFFNAYEIFSESITY